MSNYALIDGYHGIITNRVVLDGIAEWEAPEGLTLVLETDEPYEIGGTIIRGVYTPPEHQELSPAPIPASCTRLGLKRAFDEIGQWASVKAAIAANPNTQEEWDLAIEIKRTDSLVEGMIAAMGLTSGQVDALLVRANLLV